jgi:hypothetical protein
MELFISRKQSSGMWRRVDIVLTDVSEERFASIFRIEEKREETPRAGAHRVLGITLCPYPDTSRWTECTHHRQTPL